MSEARSEAPASGPPAGLLERCAELLGEGGVLTGDAVRARAAGVWTRRPVEAAAILRPRATAEVAAVLRLCDAARQPVVTHGGLTGLVQGALASRGDLVLSLERMNTVEVVDVQGRTATVQAGVPLQALQQAAADADLFFPVDLGARGTCTVGGTVATNAGGNRVLRWGMTRENVLGLEVVLADGRVLSSLGGMIKNNAGYDLKHWFIGSEGTLGVVTRATLRLREAPRSRCTALAACAEFDAVLAFLKHVDAGLGGTLSAFEVLWRNFYEVVTTPPARQRSPLDTQAPFYVLFEAMGGDPGGDAARFEAVLAEAFDRGLVLDAVLAGSDAQRAGLWALRDDVAQCMRFGPTFTFDVSLPLPLMPAYVQEVAGRLRDRFPEVRDFTFGHVADGNLHFVIHVGSGDEGTRAAVEACVYEPLRERGGSVSAEHGIGLEKRAWLPLARSPEEIEVMRAVKGALDPHGILNPGKVLGP